MQFVSPWPGKHWRFGFVPFLGGIWTWNSAPHSVSLLLFLNRMYPHSQPRWPRLYSTLWYGRLSESKLETAENRRLSREGTRRAVTVRTRAFPGLSTRCLVLFPQTQHESHIRTGAFLNKASLWASLWA